jgi:hypothetical protein
MSDRRSIPEDPEPSVDDLAGFRGRFAITDAWLTPSTRSRTSNEISCTTSYAKLFSIRSSGL